MIETVRFSIRAAVEFIAMRVPLRRITRLLTLAIGLSCISWVGVPIAVGAELPRLTGVYSSAAEHPRVFLTPAEVKDLVQRINVPGSFSVKNFVHLAARVKEQLAAAVRFEKPPLVCDVGRR